MVFWRHYAEPATDQTIHRGRAQVIHEFIEAADLHVRDWGRVDAEEISEAVEIIFEFSKLALAPLATELASFLFQHVRERTNKSTDALKIVTLTLPDGKDLVFEYQYSVPDESARPEIEGYLTDNLTKFLSGVPVARDLRPDQV